MVTLLVILVLATLAVARATRLIVDDKAFQWLRTTTATRLGASNPITYLVHCRWCLSLWIAAAVATPLWFITDAHDTLALTSWAGVPITVLAVAHLSVLAINAGER